MSEEAAAPVEGGQGEATVAPEAAPTAEPSPAAEAPKYGIEDEDLRGWVEAKFNGAEPTLEKIAGSYRNLEKVVGADRAGRVIEIPGPDAEPDAVVEVFNRLGRPEKAEGYDLPVPEGDDGKMAEWARGVFHEANLTAKQAAAVAEKWNEYVGELVDTVATHDATTAANAERELRKEWGAAYDQKVRGVDQAAGKLGMTPEQLEGLRNSMGPVAAMKFVDGLAGRLGEDRMDFDGEAGTGALTPNAAMRELQKLGTDKEFMAAWMDKNHPSHEWAVEKKQNLARMAAGQAA